MCVFVFLRFCFCFVFWRRSTQSGHLDWVAYPSRGTRCDFVTLKCVTCYFFFLLVVSIDNFFITIPAANLILKFSLRGRSAVEKKGKEFFWGCAGRINVAGRSECFGGLKVGKVVQLYMKEVVFIKRFTAGMALSFFFFFFFLHLFHCWGSAWWMRLVKDLKTSCLISAKEQQVLISCTFIYLFVVVETFQGWCWEVAFPLNFEKVAPPLPPPPPRCKKLWCSFEIRELGRHDNSVGRAEYVKSVQWGTHCKKAFLHSPSQFSKSGPPKELLIFRWTFIQQITSVIFGKKSRADWQDFTLTLYLFTVVFLWSD